VGAAGCAEAGAGAAGGEPGDGAGCAARNTGVTARN